MVISISLNILVELIRFNINYHRMFSNTKVTYTSVIPITDSGNWKYPLTEIQPFR